MFSINKDTGIYCVAILQAKDAERKNVTGQAVDHPRNTQPSNMVLKECEYIHSWYVTTYSPLSMLNPAPACLC